MISIRPVEKSDLETLSEHQRDPLAVAMAVFGAREHDAFVEHWRNTILADPELVARAVTVDGVLAGNVSSWKRDGLRYVGYWLGREFWGRGIASEGLRLFVAELAERPLYALVVVSNVASQRVLEKTGFHRVARQMSPEDGVEELVYRLDEPLSGSPPSPRGSAGRAARSVPSP
jgi:RimJ/RimL family protein N-acetyltransferase